jgi:hypothetical protein
VNDTADTAASTAASTEPSLSSGPGSFDLKDHPGLRLLSWLVLALLGYAVTDTYLFNPYTYVGAPPVALFATVAAIVLAAAFAVGRGGPQLERVAVALILAGMAGFATYPAALRVNLWTDGDAPRLVRYIYLGDGRFGPTAEGAPLLDFSEHAALWPFRPGDVHGFDVAHGALGFHQLNIQRVRRELRNAKVGLTGTEPE